MNDFNNWLNRLFDELSCSFNRYLELAHEFVEKVQKSEGLSEDTKKSLITLGISIIASHFIGE